MKTVLKEKKFILYCFIFVLTFVFILYSLDSVSHLGCCCIRHKTVTKINVYETLVFHSSWASGLMRASCHVCLTSWRQQTCFVVTGMRNRDANGTQQARSTIQRSVEWCTVHTKYILFFW